MMSRPFSFPAGLGRRAEKRPLKLAGEAGYFDQSVEFILRYPADNPRWHEIFVFSSQLHLS